MRRLVLATHNAGKVSELAMLLGPLGFEIVSSGELGVPAPEETGTTFLQNAEIKALAVRAHPAVPREAYVLADDSGLCVKALGGLPGVDTANYGGFAKLLEVMKDEQEDRSAFFVCMLVLINPKGMKTVVEGRVEGRISEAARGEDGFGFDPVFIPENQQLTFAEMGHDAKNVLSHRGRALRNLLNVLNNA